MSLASKLPWNHSFAGGYPGLSSQPLPTDADAIDYLSRMATADGAGVEVGVATAVDAFFRYTKASGVFDAIKASCILCGARTLNGALVPLAGAAPANNNFISDDYTRGGATPGLKGDASTKYLDSNRDLDDDPLNDQHASVYVSTVASSGTFMYIGGNPGGSQTSIYRATNDVIFRSRSGVSSTATGEAATTGFYGLSRDSGTGFDARISGLTNAAAIASGSLGSENFFVFCRSLSGTPNLFSDGRLAFYSIGESLDLEALDDAVSTLVTAIGAAV